MDSTRGQGGIQMLLRAEQAAQQIVSDARNMRMSKLKQAKDEADRDAAAYRAALEKDYGRRVSESTGSSGSNVKKLDKETEVKIQGLKGAAQSVSKDVVAMLMKHVTAVKV